MLRRFSERGRRFQCPLFRHFPARAVPGYVIAQIPAGIAAKVFGGKATQTASLFGQAAALACMPLLAGRGGRRGLLGLCGCMGAIGVRRDAPF